MPKYFFHLLGDVPVHDLIGHECADDKEAEKYRKMLAHNVGTDRPDMVRESNNISVVAVLPEDTLNGANVDPVPTTVVQGKDGALVDASAVATKSVVQVDVKVVEFSKTVLKEAGFNLFSQNHAGFAFGTFAPSALTSVMTPCWSAARYSRAKRCCKSARA